jgi:hypothetical protein
VSCALLVSSMAFGQCVSAGAKILIVPNEKSSTPDKG